MVWVATATSVKGQPAVALEELPGAALPKHRNSGNVVVPPAAAEPTMQHAPDLQEHAPPTEAFDLATPNLSPRSAHTAQGSCTSGVARPDVAAEGMFFGRAAEANGVDDCWDRSVGWQESRKQLGVAFAVVILAFLCGLSLGRRQEVADALGDRGGDPHVSTSYEELYSEKLSNLTIGIRSLQGLSQVVVTAEQTYEEVYHEQLVQRDRGAGNPDEKEWDSFVQEARRTGPVFLDGKERLRDAVASMQRLTKRAPGHLRSLLQWLSKQNADEAAWYLGKVSALVDAVHAGMESAAEKFSSVDAVLDGLTREARESEEHFDRKASRLEDEAKAIEGSKATGTGNWIKHAEQALYGCQLDKVRTSLEDCKVQCLGHTSGSCSHLTYYKTTGRNNCYLHCDPVTLRRYHEADTFVLERGPEEFALDIVRAREAGAAAAELHRRWRTMREPLREVVRLSRRFRTATVDLRKGLEDLRFATTDLRAAVLAPQPAPEERERRLRLLERRVEEVVAAVEDLGGTVLPSVAGRTAMA